MTFFSAFYIKYQRFCEARVIDLDNQLKLLI